MAWYLLSLENNDRDLLHRAADAGNVQAMNAWGTYLVTRAIGETTDTNEVNRILGVAHDYFKSAAGQGDANGLYNLGISAPRRRRSIPRPSTTSGSSSARGAWWRRTSR